MAESDTGIDSRHNFLEHRPAKSTRVQRGRHRLTPIQRCLADGCSLNLDIEGLVRNAPFRQVEIEGNRSLAQPGTRLPRRGACRRVPQVLDSTTFV